MKYAIVYKVLALGGKDGNSIFRPGDPLRETDIENFDKLLKGDYIKEITKAEYEEKYAVKTGQSIPKEDDDSEDDEDSEPTAEDIRLDAIKELMKSTKDVLIEKLKESGFIGETGETKELIAAQILDQE